MLLFWICEFFTMKLKKNIAVSESGFVFDPASGDSFSVNTTGAMILEMLKSGMDQKSIVEQFTETYKVDEKQFREDLDDFVHHLKQLKMIEKDEA